MPPVNKIRTYGRTSKSIVNNSVDALNLLFSRNKAKTRHNKKRKLIIKDLPPKAKGKTLLTDDSLCVSTEDTFDKLVKSNKHEKVNLKSQNNLHDVNSVSESFKLVNSVYSPIMTRRRKKASSVIAISDTSELHGLSDSKGSKTDKSNSVIPRLLEPTDDKIDFSLEIEKVKKIVPTSLSYIKLPNVKAGEISNDIQEDTNCSKKEISYDPIFSNTFREKQMIHSSTPLIPTKTRAKIINHTISPIRNKILPDTSLIGVKDKIITKIVHSPKNSSTHLKVNKKNLVQNVPDENDWKLQVSPKVLLSPRFQRDFESKEKIESQVVHNQFCKAVHEATSDKNLSSSFLTLRKRKILKPIYPGVIKKSKQGKNVNSSGFSDNSVDKTSGHSKNLTTSLAEFNAFVEKMGNDICSRNNRTHSLFDFESFIAQNKHAINASECVDDTSRKNESAIETPVRFIAKRRRPLTDSCLPNLSIQKSRTTKNTSKNTSKIDRFKRRYSLQESTCSDFPSLSLGDVVHLPKINVYPETSTRNTGFTSGESINYSIPMEKNGTGDYNNEGENFECSSNDDINNISNSSTGLTHLQLKNLIVKLTKIDCKSLMQKKNYCKTHPLEKTDLSFKDSSISRDKSVDISDFNHHKILKAKVSPPIKKPCNSHTIDKNSKSSKFKKSSKVKKGKQLNSFTQKKTPENKTFGESPKTLNRMLVGEEANLNSSEIRESVAKTNLTKQSSKNDNKLFIQYRSDSSLFEVSNDYSVSNVSNKHNYIPCSLNRNVDELSSTTSENSLSKIVLTDNPNFSADEFENFYTNVIKKSDSNNLTANLELPEPKRQIADAQNSENCLTETLNSEFNKSSSEEEFEKFFVDAVKLSNPQSEVIIQEQFLPKLKQNAGEYIDDELFVNNMVVNSAKCLLQKHEAGRNYPSTATSEGTLIDLTSPVRENCTRKLFTPCGTLQQSKKQSVETPILVNASTSLDISDIIESSLIESSQVDNDGFRIPSANSLRRHQSKTLVLKAGKLWRRSLSVYRRSSIMLNLMNEDICELKDGNYCVCPRCKLARESRSVSNRRLSVRVVPASTALDPQREASLLENYAHHTSYVSDEILEDNLENNLRSLSIKQRKSPSGIQSSPSVTARELVLRRCGQTEPLPFEECYPKSVLQHCQKIGEGVYGEVFLFRNPNGGTSVMKVIPIEGDQMVNGERQKKFEEIFTEIIIAQELSNLRNNNSNSTSGFSEVQKVQCVQGRYPEKLIDLWDLYDETRGSENDSPEIFGEEQLYIVLQLANGGQDLEAFVFNNSVQAYTMFQQVACALAIAEEELRFEHRDLHWGNILLSMVDKNKKISFRLNGKNYEIMTKGVEVAIIDFTLSRIECDGVVIFNDLSGDPDLFTAEGDYQFEIYKLMKKKNGDNWQRFEPYTNVLWLHYMLDKAITALRYKNVQTKIHKEYISKLKHLKNDLLSYSSVKEFVVNNF